MNLFRKTSYVTLFFFFANPTFVEDIRDIKPPVYFKTNYRFIFLVGILIVVMVLILTRKFFFKKRGQEETTSVKMSPYEVAYHALEGLKAKNLTATGKIKEYYFELSYIVRIYIENRFGIRSPEMTTEEFLLSLRNSDALSGAHKNLLKGFLNLCDIVKFAKYSPTQKESDEAFASAKNFIDDTKEIYKN